MIAGSAMYETPRFEIRCAVYPEILKWRREKRERCKPTVFCHSGKQKVSSKTPDNLNRCMMLPHGFIREKSMRGSNSGITGDGQREGSGFGRRAAAA